MLCSSQCFVPSCFRSLALLDEGVAKDREALMAELANLGFEGALS